MSTDTPIVQARGIARFGVTTPLLVPSFSTRGFSDIGDLFAEVALDLRRSCLLSAFDLASGTVKADLSVAADLVLVDSGVYETRAHTVAADGRDSLPSAKAWTREMYRAFLPTIPRNANALIVSFDHYADLPEQIARATEDFECASWAARDFLLKPRARDSCIDLDQIASTVPLLAGVDVLGVTEKELGDSLLERCCTLLRLRRVLSAVGLTMPIHVFGAITPGPVLTYFMCGADIFDGLNWLRYEYRPDGLRYVQDAALTTGDPRRPDAQVVIDAARANIRFLHRLQDGMNRFARLNEIDALAEAFPVARRAYEIATTAQATVASRKEN